LKYHSCLFARAVHTLSARKENTLAVLYFTTYSNWLAIDTKPIHYRVDCRPTA